MTMAIALSLLLAASAPPQANKLIVLVQSSDCDAGRLRSVLQAEATAMTRDRHATRVVIDWPAEPVRNLDLMGSPSPIAAALEVTARPPALQRLARRVHWNIGTICRAGTYLVHERRLLSIPRAWNLGQPSPNTKTLVTLNRKAGLPPATFDREWAGPHADLALAWRKTRGGESHYVQNSVVSTIGPSTPPHDGIGEAEGPATAPPSAEEREARVKTAAHARTFQDMDQSLMFVARETILKD